MSDSKLSAEQPEIIKGWKLIGYGDDAVAESMDQPFCSLRISEDVVFVEEHDDLVRVPRDVLTRFVERMNHVDANAENDRKLGAAVRHALERERSDAENWEIWEEVSEVIASVLRNEAARLAAERNSKLVQIGTNQMQECLARISEWSDTYGDELKPIAGYADTFGDGMRVAKQRIKNSLLLLVSR